MNIAIIGGGITGLYAAHLLKQKGYNVTLFEKTSRLGGAMQTVHENGFLFELGPRAFRESPTLLQLCNELQLPILKAPLLPRYLLHKGNLRKQSAFLPLLLPHFFREPFLKQTQRTESVYEFARYRFSEKIAQTIFDPLCLGIFAGDMKKLSIQNTFPHLVQGSVLLKLLKAKKTPLFTVKTGMGSLIDALAKDLNVVLNTPITQELKGFDKTLFATPPPGEKGSLYIVNLGFHTHLSIKKGFGYLAPTQEKQHVVGVLFDSQIFPEQEGKTRLTVMLRPETTRPLEEALLAVEKHLGITQKPDHTKVTFADKAIAHTYYPSVEACLQRAKTLAL